MEKYNLFLDDERDIKDVTWITLPKVCWNTVRNYDEFVSIVTEKGLPEIITFDNDLHSEHYLRLQQCVKENRRFYYTGLKHKTGYDCAVWLVEYCRKNNLDLPKYYIHTLNWYAKDDILKLFLTYYKPN